MLSTQCSVITAQYLVLSVQWSLLSGQCSDAFKYLLMKHLLSLNHLTSIYIFRHFIGDLALKFGPVNEPQLSGFQLYAERIEL